MIRRHRHLLGVFVAVLVWVAPARAHTIYMMNDNHTDYGWNATVDVYESSMQDEIKFYLDRADATDGNAPEEQARFNGDNWYYLWLYEHNQPADFARLVSRMRDGHITFPLNPLVELYGALPTEAAIRASYYPGRMARAHGLEFLLAQEMENATIPWGVVQLWAGSGAKYAWKGVCECFHQAPYFNRTDEVFRWQGPDSSELLMKWYLPPGDTGQSYGGYAEARQAVDTWSNNHSTTVVQSAIDRFSARAPFVPLTGLFGAGWDDVNWQRDSLWQLAQAWNVAHPGGDRAVMSNGVDYFQDLEAYKSQLATVRGGWGNDWDAWPVKLAAKVARAKRGLEKLRGAEALAVVAEWAQPGFWSVEQPGVEAGTVSLLKVFEHNWADGGVGVASIVTNKELWTTQWEAAVSTLSTQAAAVVQGLVRTPNEDRVLVFNPLVFQRTDVAEVPVPGSGPYVVTDVATGVEVPSQIVGGSRLRFLASNVPSFGYRVYRYAPGTGTMFPPAVTVDGSTIDNGRYRLTTGSRGEIASLVDLAHGSRELVGSALNDFGGGAAAAPSVVDAGPVSATLVVPVIGAPTRQVTVTMYTSAIDRVEVEDEILQNWATNSYYKFDVNLPSPQLHFEEVGAIARPGLVSQGGDFQPGTRADVMTLNHFVEWEGSNYEVTLSNKDALDFQPGASTPQTFDVGTSTVNVLALGIVTPVVGDILTQGGDAHFQHGFALRGRPGSWSGADAMRWSLAHQNPLVALALPRNQTTAPLTRPTRSFLGVDAADVVVTAVKPVEESGRGILLRLWELDGQATSATVSAGELGVQGVVPTSLIETDVGPETAPNADGTFGVSLGANAMQAYRILPGPFGDGPPTTTTSTSSSTTTSTRPTTTTSSSTSSTTTSTRPTTTTTSTTVTAVTVPVVPPAEMCGNCADDDGDGLVDAEDADCCPAPLSLGLRLVHLREKPARRGADIRLKAVVAPSAPAGFDPSASDTALQITDSQGTLLCATLPAGGWRRDGRAAFTFSGPPGSGVTAARYALNRRGAIMLTASGRGLGLRASDGRSVHFAVRSGDFCSRATVDLRSKKSALILK